MFLFGKKEKVFAVFDIGSGSVGGLLIRDSHKNGFEILNLFTQEGEEFTWINVYARKK